MGQTLVQEKQRFINGRQWSYEKARNALSRSRSTLEFVENLFAMDSDKPDRNAISPENKRRLTELRAMFDQIETDLLRKELRD